MRAIAVYILGICLLSATHGQRESRFRSQRFRGFGRQLSGGMRLPVPGGYLPPTPDKPVCMPTPYYITETSTRLETVTSLSQGPGAGVSTSVFYVTRAEPSTVYDTDYSTRFSTYTDRVTSTQVQGVTSTYVTTVGGIPVTRTILSTVVIPQTIPSTSYETVSSEIVVTRQNTERDVTTVVQPLTITSTEQNYVTDTVPVRGPDATRTTTVTSQIVSTVQTQPPPSTVLRTRTIQSTIVTSTVVQPPPSRVTLTDTSTRFDVVTQTSTYRDQVTDTETYTSTVASVFTVRDTQLQTVTSTSQYLETSQYIQTSTRVTTQLVPTTVYDTDIVTRTQTGRPVFRTVTDEAYVTETLPGGVDVVTSSIYTTQYVQSTTTVAVGVAARTVTITSTVQESCGASGYNYNEPAIPFSF